MRTFVTGLLFSLLIVACDDGPTRPEEVPPVITGSISGTVRAESDGRPLAGAQIVIVPGNGAAVTDTAGRFVVTFLAPGSYTVHATRPGFDPVTTIVTLQPQDPAAEIDLFLPSEPEPTPPSLGDRLAVRTYADPFPTAEGTIRFHVDVLVTDGERLSAVTIHDSLDPALRPLTVSTVELNPEAFPHATYEIGAHGESVAVSLGAVGPTDGEYVRALTLTVPVPSIGGVYCSTAVASSLGLPSPRETTCIVRTL